MTELTEEEIDKLFVGLYSNTGKDSHYHKSKQQILKNQEIVKRLRDDEDIKQVIWNQNHVFANPEEENKYYRKAFAKIESILGEKEE